MPLSKKKPTTNSGLQIPTSIKTIAGNNDYVLMVDSNGIPYKITKANFLAGLSSSGGNGNTSSDDPYFSDVSLLMPFDGSIVDIKGKAITVDGSAVISTEQIKYGSSSIKFSGSNPKLSTVLETGALNNNLTLEFWYYFNALGTADQDLFATSDLGLLIEWDGGEGKLRFKYGSTNLYPSTNNLTPNGWHHLAFIRNATAIQTFVDGISIASSTITPQSFTENILIGTAINGRSANGYMSNLRITKQARYSANFTPPTQAFPTI
ncbi:LamG domain-containing protein [Nostoc sp. PA-18-2419]|uniref:LamG domain-containing protein n=1 Tax=Nostoc sp. PA-18-2419 TaxID=2575443 RepID=UPI001107E359|nr:LamG domain-containing protein [Nostoc sp. PA-18-2419]